MIEFKTALASRTVWAAIIGIAVSLFGLTLDVTTQGQIADLAVQGVTLAAAIVALVGRVTATKRIR